MKMTALANRRGVTLIAAVATLLILSLMGVILVTLVGTQTHSTLHQGQSFQAFYLAEAGAYRALTFLSKEGGNCMSITPTLANVSLGPGTFTVTGTEYQPTPTTLTVALGVADTTIPVVSTAGYAPRGRITIEAEQIDYTGTTATSFTGARRGANNTTPATHAGGTSVSQNQCTITSTGVIPNASIGDARGVAEVAVSVEAQTAGSNYAGAVGTNGFTNPSGAVGPEEALCAEIYGCCGDVVWIGFWNDFGFAIPAEETIVGIQVDLMQAWQGDPPTANSLGVVIGKDEGTLATEKTGGPQTEVAQGFCGTMPIESYGGPADLWGLTWTAADLNSPNFTVRLRNVDDTEFGITLNWIRVTVTYGAGGLTIIGWREVY